VGGDLFGFLIKTRSQLHDKPYNRRTIKNHSEVLYLLVVTHSFIHSLTHPPNHPSLSEAITNNKLS
jgi:hypothetical protein